jgi:hypothetical protein
MDENEVTDPLMVEADILKFFKDNFTTNPRKLIRLANQVKLNCTEYVANGLIRSILIAKNPVAYLLKCFKDIEAMVEIARDLTAQGFHGTLFMNDVVYPLKLDTRENWLKDKWSEEDELEILHRLAAEWMRSNNKSSFHGKVVLWPLFGFSGIPTKIHMRTTDDTSGMKRMPGTNFYAR